MPAESDGKPDTIATTVTEVSERVSTLVREEIELAKTEMMQKASTMARGAAAIAAGAVFGVFALVLGLGTLAWGLNSALSSLWEGFAIVFALLCGLTLGAFMFARSKLKVGAPMPSMAIDEAKKIRETVESKAGGKELVESKAGGQEIVESKAGGQEIVGSSSAGGGD